MEILKFKTDYVEQPDLDKATMSYDRQLDTLHIKLDISARLHVAHYLDAGVYALFDPDTMEVIGFQVEDWRRIFLRLHPDLRPIWYTYVLKNWASRILGWFDPFPSKESNIIETLSRYLFPPDSRLTYKPA